MTKSLLSGDNLDPKLKDHALTSVTKSTKDRTDKVRRRISAKEIAQEVLKLIHQQVYEPGDRLREQEIADRFGVSRGPVREALHILEAKSVVRIEPMKGATVVRMNDEETIIAVQISGVLFGLAAQRAAEFATSSERQNILREAKRLQTITGAQTAPKFFFRATLAVGSRVTKAARSTTLQNQLVDVRIGAPNLFGPLGFLTEDIRKKAARKWVALGEAIRDGRGLDAERLAKEIHMDACENALKVVL